MISSISKHIDDVFYGQVSKKEIDDEYKQPLPEMSTREKKPSEIATNAISHYLNSRIGSSLSKLFKPDLTYSPTSILNPIEENTMSSVAYKELGYNKNILFRYKQNTNNFFDIFKIELNRQQEIVETISKKVNLDSESIRNILYNNALYSGFNKDLVSVLTSILEELSKELHSILDINVLFIFRSISISIAKNFIAYSNDIEKPLQVIYVYVATNKTPIYFEPMLHIDLNNNTVNRTITNISYANFLLSKLNMARQSPKATPKLTQPKKSTENITEIVFEPLDKEDELPIVEVDLGSKKRRYLMGRTGNLYEDDDKHNSLVGKIVYNTSGKSTIYWCKDYIL
jgi:hypothetical protein